MALGNGAVAALTDDAIELAPQRLKVGDLAVDLRQMFAGDDIDGAARLIPVVGQSEQGADLASGEGVRLVFADPGRQATIAGTPTAAPPAPPAR